MAELRGFDRGVVAAALRAGGLFFAAGGFGVGFSGLRPFGGCLLAALAAGRLLVAAAAGLRRPVLAAGRAVA